MPQKFVIKPLLFLLLATFLTSCSMFTPKDDNMKWTAQYNFMDLYKQKVYEGYFNAGSAIEVNGIAVINSHTILLGAEKDLRAFDPEILEKQAVLFVSTDKGITYKEIPLEGSYFDSFYKTEDYCIIKTSGEHRFIYLFNNKTLKVEKIDECDNDLSIWYGIFDGRYIMYSNKENEYVMDISNRSKMYEIPKAIKNIPTYPINQNGDLIYMKNNDLYIYNVISQQEKLYKKLKNKYDYFLPIDEADSPLTLQQVKNEDDEEKYEEKIYNLDEELLYIINKDNRRKHYRYNNFICDYSALGSSPEIRFSYDYGKTWKTHNVKGFSILQSTFGFYKDEFLVTEGIFFRGNSPESGGRIMVGEFQK